ncbi:hypothetical protein OVS_03085 [Mycoplasma ovis str. Michigan]|uniref:Uncharacterized protein n=1 Tax=Mycoplasma ovis str. Michigan TaxID=1415773 RepID=A0ABM5P0T4_9MOLU|nr:hypothetical protein [Mycoplasma ovis]AHC40030.1 hypothetical protein OVS_03085 [Mycoplasma ovis str. Michigan]
MSGKAGEDFYLTVRLLMISYWLSFPILCLILIGALHFFPKNGLRNTCFFNRYLMYLTNLKGFCWITLGIAIFFNNLLVLFYLIDMVALGNTNKYSVFWSSGGSSRPLSVFWQIIIWGNIFYLLLGLVCYKKYWIKTK